MRLAACAVRFSAVGVALGIGVAAGGAAVASAAGDQLPPGLYVYVIDGQIAIANRGGLENFVAGQFGFQSSIPQPQPIVPPNPKLPFTPPPPFQGGAQQFQRPQPGQLVRYEIGNPPITKAPNSGLGGSSAGAIPSGSSTAGPASRASAVGPASRASAGKSSRS